MVEPDVLILCLGVALFGACVGSFLNVFVYRVPRRKSLVYPPSHCPHCGHPIRWYDNVPVIGWVKLRGKCRDCQLPISIRYPCVEGFCGILFGGVFVLVSHLWTLSLLSLLAVTLLWSLLGCSCFAGCLIVYDQTCH